eukprot:4302710-Pleurochrysis_carterae.AAC.1
MACTLSLYSVLTCSAYVQIVLHVAWAFFLKLSSTSVGVGESQELDDVHLAEPRRAGKSLAPSIPSNLPRMRANASA